MSLVGLPTVNVVENPAMLRSHSSKCWVVLSTSVMATLTMRYEPASNAKSGE